MSPPPVFVTGGTGYLGRPLVEQLLSRGYRVHALIRKGSEGKLPEVATPVLGDPLDASTFQNSIPVGATLIHMVGTPHPNPSKAAEFVRVDLAAIKASTAAASAAGVSHFVYLSVAHPAPVMAAYIATRVEGERLVAATGIPATVFRPWYVLGPGHRWPYALIPIYALARLIPATREGAERLALVTRNQMIGALLDAVASPPATGLRVVEPREIRLACTRRRGQLA